MGEVGTRAISTGVAIVVRRGNRDTRCNADPAAQESACLDCIVGNHADRERAADIGSDSRVSFQRTATAIDGNGFERAR